MENSTNKIIIKNTDDNNQKIIPLDEAHSIVNLLPQNINIISPIKERNESIDISNPIIISQQLINSKERNESSVEKQIEDSNFVSANEAYELGSASEIHGNNSKDLDEQVHIKSINEYYQENALFNNNEEEALNEHPEINKDIHYEEKIEDEKAEKIEDKNE